MGMFPGEWLSHPGIDAPPSRGASCGSGRCCLLPGGLAVTSCSCGHAEPHMDRSAGTAMRETCTGTEQEVPWPYKLSVMLYPCNNHSRGAVKGTKKRPRP